MAIEVRTPPKHLEVIVICLDDTNPPKNVQDWVKEGSLYTMDGMTNALNVDDVSLILSKNGKRLQPTPNMGGFKGQRFMEVFSLCKN